MGRVVRALVLAVVFGAFVAVAAGSAGARGQAFTLTILHSNDGESKLLEQTLPDGTVFGGVARFASLVGRLRDEARVPQPDDKRDRVERGAILISSGDNFLAGPQFNASLQKGAPFYDSIALDRIGYDAFAIGNHEFDFGPDVLADFIGGFLGKPRFLSANIDVSPEPSLARLERRGRIAASTMVVERGERIGIVGATTPLLPAISSPRGVVVDPHVVAAVQAEIDALEANKVDKIILASHLQNVQEDLALIPQLSGVDVAIAGGGDELLANPDDPLIPGDVPLGTYPMQATNADGAQVPVITTSGDYKYVGKLVVTFDREGSLVSVDAAASGPVRVVASDGIEPDPVLQEQVVASVQAAVDSLAANVVGTSQVALEGRRGPTPPGVRTTETNLGNLLADALLWQGEQLAAAFGVDPPDVALQNGGGIRNNTLIPAGPITELNTFEIAAFGNFVSIVSDVPRDQFKEILENAVSAVPVADGRFAQIAGFTMSYDPAMVSQVVDNAGTVLTPGSRIVDVTLDDGTVIVEDGAVVPGDPIAIATNDFSARGGDQYPFRGLPFTTIGVTYQQALLDYITDPLAGQITAADYPEGGEGRITMTTP